MLVSAPFMNQRNETLEQNEESIEISHPETLSVWGLAWPPILGNLLWSSVGIISIKAVGSLGAEAVAAVGTGQRLVWVFQALLMAVMTGKLKIKGDTGLAMKIQSFM